MSWESLGKSLSTRPRVLAGPVLRKVTPTSVTVWLAMRIGALVELTVQNDNNQPVLLGERHSVAIGANLHIVAVTATILPSGMNITEGIVYRYDLAFTFDDSFSCNLATATGNANLAYPPWNLPSFALPPQDLSLLRLIQGSCRKPHGNGTDMLSFVSQMIEQSAGNAFARPHQLLLTGDQIYADDVADAMSLMLSDAGEVLLGWTEQYPSSIPAKTLRPVTDLHPALREHLLKDAGFTSKNLRCHLIGLGEFLAMYLFVWSDVLWPSATATIPVFGELAAEFGDRISAGDDEVLGRTDGLVKSRRNAVRSQGILLQEFRRTLPQVRRVLANLPTYMIFDDHEVTDDWNMTRGFCDGVYGNELGLRVVQNALVAYALCQHWGNTPEQFEDSAQAPPPGITLLQLLDKGTTDTYTSNSSLLRERLGVHDANTLKARIDYGLFHDADALTYHHTVEGPSHQVIFTDTRTWRSFPSNSDGTHLLTKNRQTDQFKQQILDAPDTGDRLLFVVLTTNAPPVQPIRAATRHARIANLLLHSPDLYESWDLPSESFDRLLVALTSKLPLDATNQHTGPVVILSGDVHHGFASRIMYRATKRYEDDSQPRGATAVIAQLVASSIKNQTESTILFQREGYYAAPNPLITELMIRHTLTEGYVGWNFPKGAKEKVGTFAFVGIRRPLIVDKGTVDVSQAGPLSGEPDSRTIELIQSPHYRYRFDYLLPTEQFVQTSAPSIPPLPDGASLTQRKNAAHAFDSAIKVYLVQNFENPPKVVGVNNIGEIKLYWGGAANRKVNHILHWWDANDSRLKQTTYSVRLDLNSPTDSEFPDIKARIEP